MQSYIMEFGSIPNRWLALQNIYNCPDRLAIFDFFSYLVVCYCCCCQSEIKKKIKEKAQTSLTQRASKCRRKWEGTDLRVCSLGHLDRLDYYKWMHFEIEHIVPYLYIFRGILWPIVCHRITLSARKRAKRAKKNARNGTQQDSNAQWMVNLY